MSTATPTPSFESAVTARDIEEILIDSLCCESVNNASRLSVLRDAYKFVGRKTRLKGGNLLQLKLQHLRGGIDHVMRRPGLSEKQREEVGINYLFEQLSGNGKRDGAFDPDIYLPKPPKRTKED